MPKNRRPGNSKRQLCVKRIKSVKTLSNNVVPARNFEQAASTTKFFASAANAAADVPTHSPLRRSRRLLKKYDGGNSNVDGYLARIQRKYEERPAAATTPPGISDYFLKEAVRSTRRKIFEAASVVDLISTGRCRNKNNKMENKQQKQPQQQQQQAMEIAAPLPFEPVPPNQWVYRTPENRRTQPQRPKESKLVLAHLYTAGRGFAGFHADGAISTIVVDNEEVAVVADDGFFKGPPPMWQAYPTGHQVLPSPTFPMHRHYAPATDGPFPPPRRAFEMDDLPASSSSAFATPTMENLFPFLQAGISPFPN